MPLPQRLSAQNPPILSQRRPAQGPPIPLPWRPPAQCPPIPRLPAQSPPMPLPQRPPAQCQPIPRLTAQSPPIPLARLHVRGEPLYAIRVGIVRSKIIIFMVFGPWNFGHICRYRRIEVHPSL